MIVFLNFVADYLEKVIIVRILFAQDMDVGNGYYFHTVSMSLLSRNEQIIQHRKITGKRLFVHGPKKVWVI